MTITARIAIGSDLFANCLLALDARTGKRLWHFQMVHHDLWDYDATSAPQLVTIRQDGKTIEAGAQATKQGFLYVFDRLTGKPVWPIDVRPVPKSDMPGEQAWPTQPFSTAPPPFARQKMTADDVNPYLPAEERAKWRDRVASARTGLFTPPSMQESVALPGARGGSNWGTTADNADKGTVYLLRRTGLLSTSWGRKFREVGAAAVSQSRCRMAAWRTSRTVNRAMGLIVREPQRLLH